MDFTVKMYFINDFLKGVLPTFCRYIVNHCAYRPSGRWLVSQLNFILLSRKLFNHKATRHFGTISDQCTDFLLKTFKIIKSNEAFLLKLSFYGPVKFMYALANFFPFLYLSLGNQEGYTTSLFSLFCVTYYPSLVRAFVDFLV